MKGFTFGLGSLLFAALFASASASAQVRTYVASTGLDMNACSNTAPCRTFQVAVNAVQPGGEVVALDSAEYGPINITKAVSVVAAPGSDPTVTVTSNQAVGVAINAGAQDSVTLRGLTITSDTNSTVGNGVQFFNGQTLHIESCVVSGFTGPQPNLKTGVYFGAPGNLDVKDSIVERSGWGIAIRTKTGTAFAVLDHVRMDSDGAGLTIQDGARVTVRDSVFAGNTDGIDAGGGSGPSELTVDNCLVANNEDVGIACGNSGLATVRLSNSTVTNNAYGIFNQSGSVVISRGNNTIEGNAFADTEGVIGSYSPR